MTQITENMIYSCFAAARRGTNLNETAESFVDVEEYENQVMYPEFARWARQAGYPKLGKLFMKVAGEEKLHAVWLRELYDAMGKPERGEDTRRAIDALAAIRENCDKLIGLNPGGVVEKALRVAMRVEEREFAEIYPHFRDQAQQAGRPEEAAVYQKVIDSERQHYDWFRHALQEYFPLAAAASA